MSDTPSSIVCTCPKPCPIHWQERTATDAVIKTTTKNELADLDSPAWEVKDSINQIKHHLKRLNEHAGYLTNDEVATVAVMSQWAHDLKGPEV